MEVAYAMSAPDALLQQPPFQHPGWNSSCSNTLAIPVHQRIPFLHCLYVQQACSPRLQGLESFGRRHKHEDLCDRTPGCTIFCSDHPDRVMHTACCKSLAPISLAAPSSNVLQLGPLPQSPCGACLHGSGPAYPRIPLYAGSSSSTPHSMS